MSTKANPPDPIPPYVRALAAAYVTAGAIVDRAVRAAVATGRGLATFASYMGPGVALVRPLHCDRCRRTQHYASKATHALIAKGIRPRCWWCGHRMVLVNLQEPAR